LCHRDRGVGRNELGFEHPGGDRLHLRDGLVGLDFEQGLAALNGLAGLDKPTQYADVRPGGGQVGHFHLDLHGGATGSVFTL
jgi:hypothetical protein